MISSIPERDDLQIVVVDDCSKSEEVETLKGLSHQNLQIVLMEHNHGAGFARNEGLKRISSEWVTFVDSDDMFVENAFEVLDDYVELDYDLLCYYVKAINDKTKKELKNVLKSESSVRSFFERKTPKMKTCLDTEIMYVGTSWSELIFSKSIILILKLVR